MNVAVPNFEATINDPNLACHLRKQSKVMRNHDDTSLKLLQCISKSAGHVVVKSIRRLLKRKSTRNRKSMSVQYPTQQGMLAGSLKRDTDAYFIYTSKAGRDRYKKAKTHDNMQLVRIQLLSIERPQVPI
jgi:hypothetical protein